MRPASARIAHGLVVLLATVTLTFVVNDVLPTDPARMVAGAQARPAEVEKVISVRKKTAAPGAVRTS